MSDHFSSVHNRKKHVHVVGTTRKKTFFRLSLAILLVAGAVCGYVVVSSGILSDDHSAISNQLLTRINDQRHAGNLPALANDPALANQAMQDSVQLKLSPMAYNAAAGTKPASAANVYVLPKMSLALTTLSLEPQLFDAWSADAQFRNNVMNPQFQKAGIGIESDGYNYYIVTLWK